MEIINTEIYVSSLFKVGFDIVDPILFGYVLGKLSVESKPFKFDDQRLSKNFFKYVDYENNVFKLKKGYNLYTNVSLVNGIKRPLIKVLNTNRHLVECLNNMDYTDIVISKYNIYNSVNPNVFSNKELDILKNLIIEEEVKFELKNKA